MNEEKALMRASGLLSDARGWLENLQDKLKSDYDEKRADSAAWEDSDKGKEYLTKLEKLEDIITEIETAEGSIDELMPTED